MDLCTAFINANYKSIYTNKSKRIIIPIVIMRLRKVLFVCAILCAHISWIESVFRPKPKCNQPINIYDNLKCKPKFGKQEKICPECYDCSQIDPKINKCYYQGKYYKIGEQIDDNANLPSCYVGCYCNDE